MCHLITGSICWDVENIGRNSVQDIKYNGILAIVPVAFHHGNASSHAENKWTPTSIYRGS